MIRKVIPGKHADIKPDILIPYSGAAEKNKLGHSSITMIAVRPETNRVDYEATIIKSVAPYAHVVYMANLSGILMNDKAIVLCHYSSQLQFAVNGKDEMAKYPEMIAAFEKKFKVKFEAAPIVGAYSAILDYKVKKDGDELFRTMVPNTDFLEMYGQTIKKIEGFYVLNYDIPAIVTRHHEGTNIFIMALRLVDESIGFSSLHHMIYDNMCRNQNTAIQGPDTREKLPLEWYDRIRRTYHMSRSHIEAMFDLTDFVFKDEGQRICFAETPLGQRLLQEGVMTETQLEERLTLLKESPLVYLRQPGGTGKLVHIIHEGKA